MDPELEHKKEYEKWSLEFRNHPSQGLIMMSLTQEVVSLRKENKELREKIDLLSLSSSNDLVYRNDTTRSKIII